MHPTLSTAGSAPVSDLQQIPFTRITADDWGLSPGVNQGILELAEKGIVKRVSILANGQFVKHQLPPLMKIPGLQLGLHFNLTQGMALSNPNVSLTTGVGHFLLRCSLRSYLNQDFRNFVRSECQAQLEALERLHLPLSYVDGHHHVHVFPGIFEAIRELLEQRGLLHTRLPLGPALWLTSKGVLCLLSLRLKSKLDRWGFTYYPFVYPSLKDYTNPGTLKVRLLKQPEAEIIVHPARHSDLKEHGIQDPYSDERVTEFQALTELY